MKRILASILALTMIFALAACGTATSSKPAATPKPTATPAPTPEPTPKPTPEPTPEPVRDQDWLRSLTTADLKTYTGDILDVTYNGTDLIVKQKIKSQSNNKLTIDQNYYNACEIIRSLGGAEIRDLQYWAVADLRDGSEAKVISFTVPADTVKTIQTQQFPDNTLGNYVTDLWILPSLKG